MDQDFSTSAAERRNEAQPPPERVARPDGTSTVELSGRCVGSSYLLLRPIGQGATGTVWRAVDRASGEQVAVKLLHESLLRQPKLVTRFVQERTILQMLRHRNVVRVRDLFSVGESLGLVMDLVAGGSLRDYLRQHHTVPPGQAAGLAAQVAAALAEAHDLGVIHRDLKPDNVLLQDEDGHLDTRLTDFGVARVLDTPSFTTPHAVVGTPHYMAPEAFQGAPASPAADIYALGVLLYELVVGCPPYTSDSVADLLHQHLETEPERRPGIPDSLWAVIVSCLAKKPRLRPSAAEIAAELGDVARAAAAVPALPRPAAEPSTAGRGSPPRQQRRSDDAAASGRRPVAGPHPSLTGRRPRIPRRRNQAASWRWARPGALAALICGSMIASGITSGAWHLILEPRSPAEVDAIAPVQVVVRSRTPPAPRSPAPSRTPGTTAAARSTAAATPSAADRAHRAGWRDAADRLLPGAVGGRPERTGAPAATVAVPATRRPVPEGVAHDAWQCRDSYRLDLGALLLIRSCHALGAQVRVRGQLLVAPAGGRAGLTMSVRDLATGRTASGPHTCDKLTFTERIPTRTCGPTGQALARGHRYAVVLAWEYTRRGSTVRGEVRGPDFSW